MAISPGNLPTLNAPSTSTSPRKNGIRPPPLLLPSSASALSSPSSLSLASPVSPSFSASRKLRNAKQLSLAVPSLTRNLALPALTASRLHASTSRLPYSGVPPSPNASGDSDALDLSETRSCPPTPRLVLDINSAEDAALEASDRGELKSALQGDLTMRRRTSLPRLKILSSKSLAAGDTIPPPTSSFARPKTGVPALTVEALVARNREAGAPLDNNSGDADEDFPYQLGPKEILPGLFLGSEQNAKDPAILKHLGITHVICCAKEVACPWVLDEVLPEATSECDFVDISTIASAGNGQEQSTSTPSGSRESINDATSPTFLALPSPSGAASSPLASQRPLRAPSPSRPLFLRPAVSTPNLKEKMRGHSIVSAVQPHNHSASHIATQHAPGISTSHSGYLRRHFPASRSTGRPALDYTKLPWGHDEDDVANHFDTYQICELIDKARQDGGRCLVHCQLGVSRSATLMIGYCMRQAFRKADLSLLGDVTSMHDSYTFVRAKSRWVAPNIGLLAQLVQYERAPNAESNPDQPMPYSNSAYYDSQLSLPGQHGSGTPDNLSPSSTSESEIDSRLTTPETGCPDTVSLPPQAQEDTKTSKPQISL